MKTVANQTRISQNQVRRIVEGKTFKIRLHHNKYFNQLFSEKEVEIIELADWSNAVDLYNTYLEIGMNLSLVKLEITIDAKTFFTTNFKYENGKQDW